MSATMLFAEREKRKSDLLMQVLGGETACCSKSQVANMVFCLGYVWLLGICSSAVTSHSSTKVCAWLETGVVRGRA